MVISSFQIPSNANGHAASSSKMSDGTETANSLQKLLERLQEQHARIDDEPYDHSERLHLAQLYQELGYPDLAAGEAYLAILLLDEIEDESGEYHTEALAACRKAEIPLRRRGLVVNGAGSETLAAESQGEDEEIEVHPAWSIRVYVILNSFYAGILTDAGMRL